MSTHLGGTHSGVGSPRTTVRVNLQQNVDVEKLAGIIAGIGGRLGCRTCGLIGIDLVLAGDPGDFREVEKLPGVASVGLV